MERCKYQSTEKTKLTSSHPSRCSGATSEGMKSLLTTSWSWWTKNRKRRLGAGGRWEGARWMSLWTLSILDRNWETKCWKKVDIVNWCSTVTITGFFTLAGDKVELVIEETKRQNIVNWCSTVTITGPHHLDHCSLQSGPNDQLHYNKFPSN